MLLASSSWFTAIDGLLSAVLVPLALAILVSGLDDLTLLVVCLREWLRRWKGPASSCTALRSIPQKRTAIYVPCWKEAGVIAHMIEHNLAAIDYRSFDFFIGVYPNDAKTLEVVCDLENRFANVHRAVCPHDGPTSKADCLNWIFQRMLLFEEDHRVYFDVVVTHDAEDLIHPDSLLTINRNIGVYDMVQVPVLPLPTPLRMLTHGVYCDEFAEFQIKDMRARGLMGSFIPSSGVGTGYAREALEKLAESQSNRVFEPKALTEDYENGVRLHNLGCRQLFVPIELGANGIVATRAFFPATLTTAIRQRTRWVTGIALQSWERHGWGGAGAVPYWLWRDRKGLLGNPLSFATNLLTLCGLAAWLHAKTNGYVWGVLQQRMWLPLFVGTLALQTTHLGIRMFAVARVYGARFALGVPVRLVWANYINAASTCGALYRYARARLRHEPLVWVKTEHAYPTRAALCEHKRPLGEVLVGAGYLEWETLEYARQTRPPGIRMGEYLIQLGAISEDDLYEALSLQQSIPVKRVEPGTIYISTARSLPRRVVERLRVLPFRVEGGNLFLASPEIPSDRMQADLQGFTGMQLQFQLVTPANFEELARILL